MTWRGVANQPVGAARVADIRTYVAPDATTSPSPIDSFYDASQSIVRLGTPAAIGANTSLGPLLLVGLVSSTENYFRDIFAQVIRLCPTAQAAAADENVKLGSVVWHGSEDAIRAAFEHLSFADSDKLIASSKKYLNFQLHKGGVVSEFEKVCELRHGIVHSSGILAGKNAIVLHVPATTARLRINVGFAELQECANVCTTLVAAVNQGGFEELCRRWAVVWPKLPTWIPARRNELFRAIWRIFFSERDDANGSIPLRLTMTRCKNAVLREYK